MSATKECKKYFWDHIGAYCRVCGYDKSIRALHCHHLDKSQKTSVTDTLALAISSGHDKLKLWCKRTKFIILCANCHGELHDGYWQVPEDYLGDNLLYANCISPSVNKTITNIIERQKKDDGINRQSHNRRIRIPRGEKNGE